MKISSEQLRDIVAGCVEGVHPTSYEIAMAAELLSVRDEQSKPVALVDKRPFSNRVAWRNGGEKLQHGAELFTAPPAPAVQTVPDAITVDNAPEIFEIAAQVERIGLSGAYGAYASGWNACRAAMLQPASQGYTLNSPVIPDGWKLVPAEPTPKQWAAGIKAMDGGIDKVTLAYKAMVDVAPTPTQAINDE